MSSDRDTANLHITIHNISEVLKSIEQCGFELIIPILKKEDSFALTPSGQIARNSMLEVVCTLHAAAVHCREVQAGSLLDASKTDTLAEDIKQDLSFQDLIKRLKGLSK